MPNTITIDLDDSAAMTSLDNMIEGLGEAQTETEALAEAGNRVVQQQYQQINVIEQQTNEYKTFATTAVEAFRDISVEAIDTAGKIGLVIASGKAFSAVIKAIRGDRKDASQAAKEDTASIQKEGDSFTETALKATAFGLVLNTLTGQWESSTQAATAGGAAYAKWRLGLTNTSLIAVGVYAAVKAGDAFAETMKEIKERTDEAGPSFDDLTEKMKKTRNETASAADDFRRLENAGATAAYNLTRPFSETTKAASQMFSDIKEGFGEFVEDTQTYLYENKDLFGIGTSIKDSVQSGEESLRKWGTFFENWIDEARGNFVRFENSAVKAFGFQGDGNAERYVEEAKALRELSAWHDKMDQQRAKEKDGFAAIRKVNEDLTKSIEDRKKAEEIASISDVAAIGKRMDAARAAASTQATAAKDAKEIATNLAKELEMLEQRRTQIVAEETAKRLAKEKEAADMIKRAYEALNDVRLNQTRSTTQDQARDNGASEKELHEMRMRWIDEEAEEKIKTAKSNAELIAIEAEAEQKRIQETEQFRRDEIRRSAESRMKFQQQVKAMEDASNDVAKARAEFADAMELHSLQLRLDGEQNLFAKTKQQQEDERQRQLNGQREIHDKKLELIDREEERALKAAKTAEEEQKIIAEAEKKRIRETADFDKAMATEASQHKLKLAEEEQRKKDELQRAKVDALKPVAEGIINTQTPQQRIRELQNMRAQQARDKAISDAGFQKFEDVPPEVKRAAEKAAQAARRQATKDAMSGNVGADEQAQVAQNLANRTIGQMAKMGKLEGGMVENQKTAVQVMANQQANTDVLSRDVQQIKNVLTALQNATDPGRNRAIAGGQRG